eukprot:46786_1
MDTLQGARFFSEFVFLDSTAIPNHTKCGDENEQSNNEAHESAKRRRLAGAGRSMNEGLNARILGNGFDNTVIELLELLLSIIHLFIIHVDHDTALVKKH